MGNKLYVCNISYSVNSTDLLSLFSVYGEVKYAVVIRDKVTGASKGYGFVEMQTEEGKQEVLEILNGKELSGRTLRVSEAIEHSGGNRPHGHMIGKGTCILCGDHTLLAGFSHESGICGACSKIMSSIHYHNELSRPYVEAHEETIECILDS